MAYVDPARAPKITNKERRKTQQEACKKNPCNSIKEKGWPACVFCPHEGKVFK